MARKQDYRPRQELNDRSRNDAENYMERWSVEEVELLESEWTTKEDDLEALASLLGRTVEACRQKHYDLNRRQQSPVVEKKAKEALGKVDKWSKGFTSLEEMGF